MDDDILDCRDARAWAAWLKNHHASTTGIWLRLAKKASKTKSVSYADAVDEALCWGWIDGQKRAFDDDWSLQRFSPRRKQSIWSQINTQKAEALIDAGRMKPPGLAAIESAKADGRWDRAYASPKNMSVPDDLAAALSTSKKARAFFDALDSANRYSILHRVTTAKKAETRAKRIAEFVAMCREGKTLYPARAKKAPTRSSRSASA